MSFSPVRRTACCHRDVDFAEIERAVYTVTYRKRRGLFMQGGKDGCSCGFLVRVTATGFQKRRVDQSIVIECDGRSGFRVGTDELHFDRAGKLEEIRPTRPLQPEFAGPLTGEAAVALLNRWLALIGRAAETRMPSH